MRAWAEEDRGPGDLEQGQEQDSAGRPAPVRNRGRTVAGSSSMQSTQCARDGLDASLRAQRAGRGLPAEPAAPIICHGSCRQLPPIQLHSQQC